MEPGTSISDFRSWLKSVWSGCNFSQSKNWLRDAYLPTSVAVSEKYKLKKVEFLKRELAECEALKDEIEALKAEL